MGRTPREVWRKRVERLRESELTDRELAAEIGVNLHRLRGWKWKLPAERRGPVGTNRRRSVSDKQTSAEAKATFVEMAIAPAVGIWTCRSSLSDSTSSSSDTTRRRVRSGR